MLPAAVIPQLTVPVLATPALTMIGVLAAAGVLAVVMRLLAARAPQATARPIAPSIEVVPLAPRAAA